MISRLGRAVTHVATPFHPFGGAVDIIVVKQRDGTFRTTPWYVRFGKFQGVLKGAEKLVKIEVNGIEADFHMHLDNSGEAYFVEESDPDNFVDPMDENGSEFSKMEENDSDQIFYEFQDDLSSLEGSSDYGSSRFDNLDSLDLGHTLESQDLGSEVVLVSVDGHILTAPLSKSERNADDLIEDENNTVESTWNDLHRGDIFKSCIELSELAMKEDEENISSSEEINGEHPETEEAEISRNGDLSLDNNAHVEGANLERTTDAVYDGLDGMHVQCLSDVTGENLAVERKQTGEEIPALSGNKTGNGELRMVASTDNAKADFFSDLEISLCRHLLTARMGLGSAEQAFNSNRISLEEFKLSSESLVKNENLIVRVKGMYLPWEKVAHVILGMAVFGLNLPIDPRNVVPVESEALEVKEENLTPSRRWRLWPFKRVKTLERTNSTVLNEGIFVDTESVSSGQIEVTTPIARARLAKSPRKQIIRTNVPTTDQIAFLNLNEGQNMVTFHFSTRVLGSQKVEAHIYLWKWNTRIVISDVDGTITKSDVLGQFMPLVGKDWTHSGIARLFCAIKENGYQLLFLSARAIVQAYLTKSFLFNLKQDGKTLPNGPVVISPDGLFPSLYREVIRRAPHEFKIGCLEDIKALFPPNYNPFYAGFGNRDTDELSYRKIGIPKGKIFIINPKGEVAINNRIDVKSYTSLHTLVHDMFPPTSLVNDNSPSSLAEKEEYNEWNYWRTPLPEV